MPQADLALRLSEVPRDRDVLVVCHGGARSLGAVQFLKGLGYHPVTNMAEGPRGWIEAGHPVAREAYEALTPVT